jgi:hypothetical protein
VVVVMRPAVNRGPSSVGGRRGRLVEVGPPKRVSAICGRGGAEAVYASEAPTHPGLGAVRFVLEAAGGKPRARE